MEVTVYNNKSKICVTTHATEIQVYGLVDTPFVTTSDGKLVDILLHNKQMVTVTLLNAETVTGELVKTYPLTVKVDNGIAEIQKYASLRYHGDNTAKTITVLNRNNVDEEYTYHYMTSLVTWSPVFHHFLESGNVIRTSILASVESHLNTSFTGATLVTNASGGSSSSSRRIKESYTESCEKAVSSSNSSSDNCLVLIKYRTNDVIHPGNNTLVVDDEVSNPISSVFVVDLKSGRHLASQLISYTLLQDYPSGRHFFYDTKGDLLGEGTDGEYRTASLYKREVGTTAEITAYTRLVYNDRKGQREAHRKNPDAVGELPLDEVTIETELTRTREGDVVVRKQLSDFKVHKVVVPDDCTHYFEEQYLFVKPGANNTIKITILGEAGKYFSV